MQTNVPTGTTLRRTAGADLSAKKDFIVMLDSSDEIQLHDGSLKTPYILLENTDDTKEGAIQALTIGEPVRVKSASAHTKHAAVYLDVATGKATPTASAVRLGFALEAKADTSEGTVAIRPDPALAPVGTLTALAGTLTGTADGTLEDIAATAGSCAGGAEPSAAQVDTAIATAVASIVTGTNLQLKELMTRLNALTVLVQKAR